MTMTMTKVYTVDQVAEFLQVHPRTVYRSLDKNTLKGFRIGTSWRVTQEALEEFMRQGGE